MIERKKKRGKAGKSQQGSLRLIRISGSTERVLNLPLVKERWGEDPDYLERPLLKTRRLNEAMILKHTPREHEKATLELDVISATKIVLPFCSDDLDLGGQSVLFEQPDAEDMLCDALGRRATDEDLRHDFGVLRVIAELPSLDPYLLSERLRRDGYKVSNRYFDVSEADAQKMREHVNGQIKNLVMLAFSSGSGGEVAGLAEKFTKIFLQNETSEELKPLRQTMRMSEAEYAEGMFAWKGFLYYQWKLDALREALKPVAREILSVHIKQAAPDELQHFRAAGERIIKKLGIGAANVQRALAQYDEAYDALVGRGEPGAFRDFLLAAPQMFMETGVQLATLSHIISFWRFRFPADRPKAINSWDAYDLFQEFESSLSGVEADPGHAAAA